MTRIIGRKELLRLVPYSMSQLNRLEAAGAFPARVRLGPHRVGWVLEEVESWIKERMDQRGKMRAGDDARAQAESRQRCNRS